MTRVVYTFDLTDLHLGDLSDPVAIRRIWDISHLVFSLQGLVNRDEPRLYVRLNGEIDDFWIERLTDSGAWMEGTRFERIDTLESLLEEFREFFHGAVVYDDRVPATSNLASTIAGVEGLLCLRHDAAGGSLYQELVEQKKLLRVRRSLLHDDGSSMFTGEGTIWGTNLPSTGSAKNDAYRWLIESYIRKGRVSPRILGYYIDAFWLWCGKVGWPVNHTLSNHDYVIARGGVFFDLNVWEDEAPVEEPQQRPGTDVETLKLLLRACWEQLDGKAMTHIAGYVPWRYKYTDCVTENWSAGSQHGAVAAEWKFTEIATCFNAYLDADALEYASMANASFFMHFPLPDVVHQNPRVSIQDLKDRGLVGGDDLPVDRNFYAHYVGDYDAAAWLYWNLPEFWRDPARGRVPLSWAFNPNLSERFGFGLEWTRRTMTPNDFFVAGDSGAGYVNPRNLSEPREHSHLPGAMHLWEEHCHRHMQQWDLGAVGFVLDGNCETMLEEGWQAYRRFAPRGLVFHKLDREQGLYDGMPFLRIRGDLTRGAAEEAAAQVHSEFRNEGLPNFICFRSVLMPPSWYVTIEEEIDKRGRGDAVLVDIETLLLLVKLHEQSKG